jgi:hypothetical protein
VAYDSLKCIENKLAFFSILYLQHQQKRTTTKGKKEEKKIAIIECL